MTSRKLEHLNERLRYMLGTILERESHDPRFRHVTVTGVHLAKDLSHARVTYTTYDALVPGTDKTTRAPGQPPKSAPGLKPKASERLREKPAAPSGAGDIASLTKSLNQAAGFFSHAVARTLETRVTPRLTFVYDPAIDYTQHMENVLKPLRAAGEMGDPNRPAAHAGRLREEPEALSDAGGAGAASERLREEPTARPERLREEPTARPERLREEPRAQPAEEEAP